MIEDFQMTLLQSLGIDKMSKDERFQLLHEIWESLADESEVAPLTPAQKQELERRLADHIANPGKVVPWEDVLAKALARASQ
jgi:putative addiction module component (TIGR02574 family)